LTVQSTATGQYEPLYEGCSIN